MIWIQLFFFNSLLGDFMSAIANIVVFDGAATPVTHTLVPESVSRESKTDVVCEWREQLSTLPKYAQIRASTRISLLKSGVYKVEARSVVPVMEAILNQNAAGYTAAPKVAYENQFICTAFLHQRSSVTDRRLARQILVNMLGNVSTSVAAATTGPLPELFDQLVNAT